MLRIVFVFTNGVSVIRIVYHFAGFVDMWREQKTQQIFSQICFPNGVSD